MPRQQLSRLHGSVGVAKSAPPARSCSAINRSRLTASSESISRRRVLLSAAAYAKRARPLLGRRSGGIPSSRQRAAISQAARSRLSANRVVKSTLASGSAPEARKLATVSRHAAACDGSAKRSAEKLAGRMLQAVSSEALPASESIRKSRSAPAVAQTPIESVLSLHRSAPERGKVCGSNFSPHSSQSAAGIRMLPAKSVPKA